MHGLVQVRRPRHTLVFLPSPVLAQKGGGEAVMRTVGNGHSPKQSHGLPWAPPVWPGPYPLPPLLSKLQRA